MARKANAVPSSGSMPPCRTDDRIKATPYRLRESGPRPRIVGYGSCTLESIDWDLPRERRHRRVGARTCYCSSVPIPTRSGSIGVSPWDKKGSSPPVASAIAVATRAPVFCEMRMCGRIGKRVAAGVGEGAAAVAQITPSSPPSSYPWRPNGWCVRTVRRRGGSRKYLCRRPYFLLDLHIETTAMTSCTGAGRKTSGMLRVRLG